MHASHASTYIANGTAAFGRGLVSVCLPWSVDRQPERGGGTGQG